MSSNDQLVFVVPGDINTRTGGYRYDKRIIEELRTQGRQVLLVELEGDYPHPTAAQLAKADRAFDAITDSSQVVIDGLAYSVMPRQLAKHANRLKLIALIHHPLALETDLTPAQRHSLKELETASLAFAHQVITTSESTAEALSQYDVDASRIIAVCPGVDAATIATNLNSEALQLLCVATLTPRKGHSILLNALKLIDNENWHLNCAGSLKRAPQTSDQLIAQRAHLGLNERITFLGELEDHDLDKQYQQADVFVLPSFHEGYGMVLDEAISYGLPIIASDAGAIPHTMPEGTGLLVPPGDPQALARALFQIITNKNARSNMRKQALVARSSQRSWSQAGLDFKAALDQ
ncbi:MAG: glycosyltransferase family 4 protein [Granulosicoccus sp.]